MTKITLWIAMAVLIAGGLVAWNWIPDSWLEPLPRLAKIASTACAALFSLFVLAGYVIDSGIPGKIFRRK